MPLIDRDGWYKKHAVTTTAKFVAVEAPRRGSDSSWQKVTADVLDPQTGKTVRIETDLLVSFGQVWHAGDEARVRWSSKRQSFRIWSRYTVPEEDYLAELNRPSSSSASEEGELARQIAALIGGSVVATSDSAATPDSAATQHATEEPIEARLAKLDRLRDAGVLSPEEHEQQRRRILDSL